MSQVLVFTLLFFGALGFAGAGMAWAVARARELEDGDTDVGMRVVSLLLCLFAAACSYVAAGLVSIFAFGGVIAWFSYVMAAQRVGVFRLVYWSHDPGRTDVLQGNAYRDGSS